MTESTKKAIATRTAHKAAQQTKILERVDYKMKAKNALQGILDAPDASPTEQLLAILMLDEMLDLHFFGRNFREFIKKYGVEE